MYCICTCIKWYGTYRYLVQGEEESCRRDVLFSGMRDSRAAPPFDVGKLFCPPRGRDAARPESRDGTASSAIRISAYDSRLKC